MSKRTCDSCGKDKQLKGGKTCGSGHFICKECVWSSPGILGPSQKKRCPLCDKPLK